MILFTVKNTLVFILGFIPSGIAAIYFGIYFRNAEGIDLEGAFYVISIGSIIIGISYGVGLLIAEYLGTDNARGTIKIFSFLIGLVIPWLVYIFSHGLFEGFSLLAALSLASFVAALILKVGTEHLTHPHRSEKQNGK